MADFGMPAVTGRGCVAMAAHGRTGRAAQFDGLEDGSKVVRLERWREESGATAVAEDCDFWMLMSATGVQSILGQSGESVRALGSNGDAGYVWF